MVVFLLIDFVEEIGRFSHKYPVRSDKPPPKPPRTFTYRQNEINDDTSSDDQQMVMRTAIQPELSSLEPQSHGIELEAKQKIAGESKKFERQQSFSSFGYK